MAVSYCACIRPLARVNSERDEMQAALLVRGRNSRREEQSIRGSFWLGEVQHLSTKGITTQRDQLEADERLSALKDISVIVHFIHIQARSLTHHKNILLLHKPVVLGAGKVVSQAPREVRMICHSFTAKSHSSISSKTRFVGSGRKGSRCEWQY